MVEEPKAAKFVHTYETEEVLVSGKPKKHIEHRHKDPKDEVEEGLRVSAAPKSMGGFRILHREAGVEHVKAPAVTIAEPPAPVIVAAPPISAKDKLANAKMLLKALKQNTPAVVTEEQPRIAVSSIDDISVSPIAPVKAKPKGFLVPSSVIKKHKK